MKTARSFGALALGVALMLSAASAFATDNTNYLNYKPSAGSAEQFAGQCNITGGTTNGGPCTSKTGLSAGIIDMTSLATGHNNTGINAVRSEPGPIATVPIDMWGICRYLYNPSTNSHSVFAPFSTKTEWKSFTSAAAGAGVTAYTCSRPQTVANGHPLVFATLPPSSTGGLVPSVNAPFTLSGGGNSYYVNIDEPYYFPYGIGSTSPAPSNGTFYSDGASGKVLTQTLLFVYNPGGNGASWTTTGTKTFLATQAADDGSITPWANGSSSFVTNAGGECGSLNGRTISVSPQSLFATDPVNNKFCNAGAFGTRDNVAATPGPWSWTCDVYSDDSHPHLATCGAAYVQPPQCGPANGSQPTSAPTSGLCSVGTASAVVNPSSGVWTWSCTQPFVATPASCSASAAPVYGQCSGMGAQASAPTSGFCNAGTYANDLSGSGPWTYHCNGFGPGGTNATCNVAVAPVDAKCGSDNNATLASLSSVDSNLCSSGVAANFATPGANNQSGYWTWDCNGLNGGAPDTCGAYNNPPTDGVCGSDSGQRLTATPTNKCTAGTASAVTAVSDGWTWSCSGSNGGSAASCAASNQSCVPAASVSLSYTTEYSSNPPQEFGVATRAYTPTPASFVAPYPSDTRVDLPSPDTLKNAIHALPDGKAFNIVTDSAGSAWNPEVRTWQFIKGIAVTQSHTPEGSKSTQSVVVYDGNDWIYAYANPTRNAGTKSHLAAIKITQMTSTGGSCYPGIIVPMNSCSGSSYGGVHSGVIVSNGTTALTSVPTSTKNNPTPNTNSTPWAAVNSWDPYSRQAFNWRNTSLWPNPAVLPAGAFCSSVNEDGGDTSMDGAVATFDLSGTDPLTGNPILPASGDANFVIPNDFWQGVRTQTQADAAFKNFKTLQSSVTHDDPGSSATNIGELIYIPNVATSSVTLLNPGTSSGDDRVTTAPSYSGYQVSFTGNQSSHNYKDCHTFEVDYDSVAKTLTVFSQAGCGWKVYQSGCGINSSGSASAATPGKCNGKVWGQVEVIAPAQSCSAYTLYDTSSVLAQTSCAQGITDTPPTCPVYKYKNINQGNVCGNDTDWIDLTADPYWLGNSSPHSVFCPPFTMGHGGSHSCPYL